MLEFSNFSSENFPSLFSLSTCTGASSRVISGNLFVSLSNRELVKATKKAGPYGDDVAKSMQVLSTLFRVNPGVGALHLHLD